MRLSVDVHNFLQNKEIQHEIFLASEPVKTAERASAILGLKPAEIAKSIILSIDGKPVNAVIPGNRNVSMTKIKTLFSDSIIRMADSRLAVDSTGYMIGSTPPVAHHGELRTIIDVRLMKNGVLYTAGGEPNAVLKIRPEDLKKATSALEADISE